MERAKIEADDVVRLREENRRLRFQQPASAELEQLRSDDVALPRLRAELEALQQPRPAAK